MPIQDLNLAVILPIIGIELILMAIALVDLAKRETTKGPKLMWVFIIILATFLEPLLTLRSEGEARREFP